MRKPSSPRSPRECGARRRCRRTARGAVAEAVADAGARDVILLAGKGHEPYQEIAGVRHPYSDLAAAKSALEARR
jgi:UDP-N-acetylmuramoyl-L-alanyl-D-glutamate--2,6-diaminopimelate ligase